MHVKFMPRMDNTQTNTIAAYLEDVSRLFLRIQHCVLVAGLRTSCRPSQNASCQARLDAKSSQPSWE